MEWILAAFLLSALIFLWIFNRRLKIKIRNLEIITHKKDIRIKNLDHIINSIHVELKINKEEIIKRETELQKLNAQLIDLNNKQSKNDSLLKSAENHASDMIKNAEISASAIIQNARYYEADKIKETDDSLKIKKENARSDLNILDLKLNETKQDIQSASDMLNAIRNQIEGYGDHYLIPTYNLLDELADEWSHTLAGEKLQKARENSRLILKQNNATTTNETNILLKIKIRQFIIDAFNGKVDLILSKSKKENYGILAQEIKDAFTIVNEHGAAFSKTAITKDYLDARINELKWAVITYELKEKDREEQKIIKEKIREEECAQREYERALKDAAKEEDLIKKAIEKIQQQAATASENQRAEYELKLFDLTEKLKAAEDKNQRAISMAQQTKVGHVYVISNTGSFGEDVFKIGMTRRLDPLDRVRELGDASVPFEFDVHAMIFCNDAPALEKSLHHIFRDKQVNKVNPRKEFFRLNLTEVQAVIEKTGIQAHWTLKAQAHQYHETIRINEQIQSDPEVAKNWIQSQQKAESEKVSNGDS